MVIYLIILFCMSYKLIIILYCVIFNGYLFIVLYLIIFLCCFLFYGYIFNNIIMLFFPSYIIPYNKNLLFVI